MQNDEIIWNVINKHFCSFKKKTDKEDMCRNEYNVTGKCNRVSCPLANSNYGTVMEKQGKLYLCLKTVERAHLPSRLWERIKLSRNIPDAKKTIELHMRNVYPEHQIDRCKRRAIKLKNMIDRMRRLELKPKEKLEGVKKKTERREATREKKALSAAHIEDVIEDELLKRLHQGVYGDLYEEHRLPEDSQALQQSQERPEVTEEMAAESGAIRFEEAGGSEEDASIASSDFGSDSDLESDTGSEEFSFSDSDSDMDSPDAEKEKERSALKEETDDLVDVEDFEEIVKAHKKRPTMDREGTVPVATLRRQATKRRNTRTHIQYEPEALAEDA
ncbi:protein MAK16 homolog [Cyclospora cayetanensis]|uniref:Protein MAK16 homolog n=2 Tax=Cyclospora cayetanensis TaxID=88456 RepID=A0A6P5WFY3_9EIME|nr:protein MAK16 homolog [Cyclospora cayetanensis]OEH79092.1 putative MAK16 protein [Cyclospora cayetanensis]